MPAGHTRLRGAVGLQGIGNECGDGVVFRVVQDGVTRWQSGTLRSYSQPEELADVVIHAGPVQLVADPLGDISCDMATWLDLRVVP